MKEDQPPSLTWFEDALMGDDDLSKALFAKNKEKVSFKGENKRKWGCLAKVIENLITMDNVHISKSFFIVIFTYANDKGHVFENGSYFSNSISFHLQDLTKRFNIDNENFSYALIWI